MASQPIACADHRFEGHCSACSGNYVTGILDAATCEFVTIENKKVAVTGTIAIADCGHTGIVQGQSTILSIEGKTVARLGDPVVGTVNGNIIEGFDFIKTE